jgi:hypothetical protein
MSVDFLFPVTIPRSPYFMGSDKYTWFIIFDRFFCGAYKDMICEK